MFSLIISLLRDLFRPRRDLLVENLALRQQIVVLRRTNPKPSLSTLDKAFWVILYRKWEFWRRPRISYEVIELIKRMSRENPTWAAPRIHGELMKLGYWVSESTVARYMIKRRGRPTQDWKTFIRNHLDETIAIDFLTVPTVLFRNLYVFVILSLDRRRIIHFNVTSHPTAEWTALQITQAFPFETAPRFLIRDRDKIFGAVVEEALTDLGIE